MTLPTPRQAHRVRSVEVRPGRYDQPAVLATWAGLVGTLAAWAPTELLQPEVEHSLSRTARRGSLRETVSVTFHDPIGLVTDSDVESEARELLRPIERVYAVCADRRTERLQSAGDDLPHVFEIRCIAERIPEGRAALGGLFRDLSAGLQALAGPVSLTMRACPGPPEPEPESPEDVDEGSARRVRFALTLRSSVALPASLRARAEALCLAERPRADGDSATIETTVSTALAAAMLALGGPAPISNAAEHWFSKTGAPIGRARHRGRSTPWRLSWEQRRHHVLVAGASGCGKSTTLVRLASDDIEAGRMVVLLDAHGDLGDDVRALVGTEGVCAVDPREPATESLDLLDPDPARAAATLSGAAAELWPAASVGPVWQRCVSLALRALAARPEGVPATLVELEQFLVDPTFRSRTIARLGGTIRSEISHEVRAWDRHPSGRADVVSSIAGTLTLLTDGPARSLVNDVPWRDLGDHLQTGRSSVIALPMGVLGANTTRLAGRMLLNRLATAIAAQGALPEHLRRPISLIVDEAQLFVGPILSGLLTQARAFNVSVTLATQAPSTMRPHLGTVLTNTETLVLGRLPAFETALFADRAGVATAALLPTLPRPHLAIVDAHHGGARTPLVLSPIPPIRPPRERLEQLVRH